MFQEAEKINQNLPLNFSLGGIYSEKPEMGWARDAILEIHSASVCFEAQNVKLTATANENKEQKKLRLQKEKNMRIETSATLIKAIRNAPDIGLAYEILNKPATGHNLGNIYELIKDDLGNKISELASERERTRFNRSINHQDILGTDARHSKLKTEPPKNPMDINEAQTFMTELLQKWVELKGQ